MSFNIIAQKMVLFRNHNSQFGHFKQNFKISRISKSKEQKLVINLSPV